MITDTKYLGVQEQVKAKALRALGLFKHSKKSLPSCDLQKMYRGIVEPHFSYCCSAWDVVEKLHSILFKRSRIELQTAALITLGD